MTDEFPAELIERCAEAAAKVWTSENKAADIAQAGTLFQPTAIAVLRASGHAELVKALKELAESSHQLAVKNVVKADAALKAAGEK